jgi:hypothetical protein
MSRRQRLMTAVWTILMMGSMAGGAVGFSAPVAADHPGVDVTDLDGSGTEDDPYVITTASELQAMEDDLTANYVLGADINASETAQWNNGKGFDPVGDGNGDFKGKFNGNGHNITQLVINRRNSNEEVGLFGEVDGAVIESVHLASVTVAGNRSVGAVVGLAEPNTAVRRVSVSGSVSGNINVGVLVGALERSSVRTVSTSGSATGSNDIGGVAGQNVGGVIRQSSSQATVTATGAEQGGDFARAGGIAGGNFNNGIINNSYATGNVSGGKAGGITGENFNSSQVSNTYAVGNISGRTNQSTGGVVGDNFPSSTVADSYWDEQATGQATSAGGVGLTTAEMQGASAQNTMTGLDFETTWQAQTDPTDYPILTPLDSTDSTPTATFVITPSAPIVRTSVTFDASTSTAPDGSIQRYEWDLDGDGRYEQTGQTTTTTFGATGEQTVTLRVTDASGASDTTTQTVTITDQQDPVERFDTDGDGDISLTEVQDAIRAFSNGEVDLQGVQQVIAAFSR